MRYLGGHAAQRKLLLLGEREARCAQTSRSQGWGWGGILSFRDVWAMSGDIFGCHDRGFPGGLDSKESAHNAGDLGSTPGLGRSPGEGNGNPLQYSYLENSMDRGAWWAAVHGAAQSQTRLSD